jgi:hypothetical protein
MLFELSDLLAVLTLERRERYERVSLIVPLKKDRVEQGGFAAQPHRSSLWT